MKSKAIALIVLLGCFSSYAGWLEQSGNKNLTIEHFGFVNGRPAIYFGNNMNEDGNAHGDAYHFYFSDSYNLEENKKSLVALLTYAMMNGKTVRCLTQGLRIVKIYINK